MTSLAGAAASPSVKASKAFPGESNDESLIS